MKIQPTETDFPASRDSAKPVLKSRLKRLLDRPFTNVLRSSSSDKPLIEAQQHGRERDGAVSEFEPSSVVLAKMVQSYMEGSNERQASRNGRNRCNCFNGNNNDDSSDDEFDLFGCSVESFNDAYDHFKVTCKISSIFAKPKFGSKFFNESSSMDLEIELDTVRERRRDESVS